MILFHIRRSLKDLMGHATLILFPLILIYLYKTIDIQTGM